jgi:pimeloyl-ACP methyl ester carboxylesterase
MPYGSLLDTARRRFELMGIPISFPFAELLVLWGGLQFGSNGFELNPVQHAKDATMPVLLLGGRNDYQVSPRVLNDIASNVVRDAETHIFENSGHESLLAAQPDEY